METTEDTRIPPELLARIHEAALKAMTGVRDRDEMRRACEDMDRIREEIQAKHGILDIAVPAIRELRDE